MPPSRPNLRIKPCMNGTDLARVLAGCWAQIYKKNSCDENTIMVWYDLATRGSTRGVSLHTRMVLSSSRKVSDL